MKVLRQLQFKFVYSMIFIEMVVFAIILVSLNFTITRREYQESKEFLTFLVQNNGHRPKPKPLDMKGDLKNLPYEEIQDFDATSSASREQPEDILRTFPAFYRVEREHNSNLRNYFAVRITEEGNILEVIQDFPLNYTTEEIKLLILSALEKHRDCDSIGGVLYCMNKTSDSEYLICFLNRNSELKTLSKLYIYSTLLYILSIFISVIISIPTSNYMIRPAREAFIKQKQFIADASHELKTPIAVIGANIDVLEGEIKNNKWLAYIKAENKRMGELVKDLLYLAKNDSGQNNLTFTEFDFSNAVENSVLPFEVIAFEAQKKLEFDIQKGITCVGDEKSIKQVCIILVDNALKNSEPGAEISVKAYAEGQKVIYKVHNTGAGIPKEELEKIFLRFYRSDSSRVRKTGGYGLGLAIARSIANDHGGSLVATSELGKWAEFTLTIPKKR
ncbi:MAG: HAMP domain-containing histidine kinase [Treponema sp.]|nr:HAMP domain-containing histidine kinase [Treponema sp.]